MQCKQQREEEDLPRLKSFVQTDLYRCRQRKDIKSTDDELTTRPMWHWECYSLEPMRISKQNRQISRRVCRETKDLPLPVSPWKNLQCSSRRHFYAATVRNRRTRWESSLASIDRTVHVRIQLRCSDWDCSPMPWNNLYRAFLSSSYCSPARPVLNRRDNNRETGRWHLKR